MSRASWAVATPVEHPTQVAHRHGVVVLHAEGTGVVQRPIAHHGHHRQAQAGSHGDGLEGVEPTHPAGAAKSPGPHRRGVLYDLKLGMLAFGDDEVAVEGAIGLELGHVLHYGCRKVVWGRR